MTKVFIAGSRRVTRVDDQVARRIDRIVSQRFQVLVGDANGADKAVQEYLRRKEYDLVEVYCSNGVCRNNRGDWPVRAIAARTSGRKDFSFYAAKDLAMAEEATVGLMLWDGESLGTLLNVQRLVRRDKKTVVYVTPIRDFVDVRSEADWERLIARCSSELRSRVDRESAAELGAEQVVRQASLL